MCAVKTEFVFPSEKKNKFMCLNRNFCVMEMTSLGLIHTEFITVLQFSPLVKLLCTLYEFTLSLKSKPT